MRAGGSEMLTHEDLEIRYDTVCDPRLSESQCKFLFELPLIYILLIVPL